MSSTIYNHRNLQPTVQNSGLTHSAARLNECLETIKQEFDAVLHDSSVLKSQRDDYEGKLTSQVNELNIIRQALYDLEAQHSRIRQQYEEELLKLRNELHHARQQAHNTLNPQYPPGLGPASASAQPPLPPLQPAPPQPQPTPQPPPPQAQGPPPQQQYPIDPYPPRDRPGDRDLRDRDREREQREREQRERERERDRERDRDLAQRDPKRIKTEKPQSSKSDQRPSEPQHPLAQQQQSFHSKSQSTSSQGPPQPQPQPPQQQQQPQQQQSVYEPAPQSQQAAPPQPYGDLDLENVPAEYKKHGQDWVAVFNPRVPRVLDVNLMHTFSHESVVCCVRFSADGRFLATGCNRSAQIYDIKTGQKTHVLVDESASKTGDLYIRSVCFSPDGKYLATGAEDKQIRIWDIAKKRIRTVFEGHGQEIYSLDFSADGALIVSGSGDKTARIWPMEGNGNATVLAIDEPENVDAGVTSVAISPDGRFVAAGSLDTVVRIWDVATGTLIERLQGHMDSVYSVAFTPDGKGLVSGSLDKTLKLWDVAPLYRKGVQPLAGAANAGKKEGGERGSVCLMDYKGHRDYVLSVAVSHDGQWIVSGSKDRGVQFWDARNAAVQLTLQGHKNSVISIDLSPTSGMLATGSGDSQARVWRFGPQG